MIFRQSALSGLARLAGGLRVFATILRKKNTFVGLTSRHRPRSGFVHLLLLLDRGFIQALDDRAIYVIGSRGFDRYACASHIILSNS